MLEIKITQPTSSELAELETEIKQAASDMMVAMLGKTKLVLDTIRADIRQQLERCDQELSPESRKRILDRFPWFTPTSLANTYCKALQVQDKGQEIGIVCDTDLLVGAKLPENLSDILEYGTDITPMFPHLRAGMALLERELNAIADSTNR